MKLINIRGANGSGKSFLVYTHMCRENGVPYPRRNNLLGGDTLTSVPEYYCLNDGGIVVGPYLTNCGGCDALDSTEAVKIQLRRTICKDPKYVLFEGVIISTVFETWLQFSKEVGGMIWVYLDTPVEVCLQRIQERNRGKQIKEQPVRDKIKWIESTRKKALQAGEQVVTLHYQKAHKEFQALLNSL